MSIGWVKNCHTYRLIFACSRRNCAQIICRAITIIILSLRVSESSSTHHRTGISPSRLDLNGSDFFAQVDFLHLITVLLNASCFVDLWILISSLFENICRPFTRFDISQSVLVNLMALTHVNFKILCAISSLKSGGARIYKPLILKSDLVVRVPFEQFIGGMIKNIFVRGPPLHD